MPFWRYVSIGFLSLSAYFLSYWSLAEGMTRVSWITVLVMPFLLTAATGFFYFLIPGLWIIRFSVAAVFGIIFYILLLTENIFAVAAIRTIQLLRSAQAVGFLLVLLVGFFLYNTIFSFRLDFWWNFLLVFATSFPLMLQSLWKVNLEEKIGRSLWVNALAISVVLAETAVAFSFWPMAVAISSLGLLAIMYMALGLAHHYLSERFFKRTVVEYLVVGFFILLVVIFNSEWGGGR